MPGLWVIGLLDAHWDVVGGLLGAVLGPPGASWGPLGRLLGPLGALLAPLGASLGLLGALLGPSWGHLGRLKRQSGEVAKMPENAIRIAFSGPREIQEGPKLGQVGVQLRL